MEVMITRRGGAGGTGGAALNFSVVGGTAQPGNPAENTIWVSTDAEITGWVFNSVAPEVPAEGMVWIGTDEASNAPFNALKENAIIVYPIGAKQYIDGTWVAVNANIYYGGIWTELLNGILYDYGDECKENTGGWEYKNYATSATASGTLTKNSDHMVAKIVQNANGGACTVDKVDLSGYSTLKIEYKSATNGTVVIANNFPTTEGAEVLSANIAVSSDKTIASVPIDGVDGQYKILIRVRQSVNTPFYIYKIWLE